MCAPRPSFVLALLLGRGIGKLRQGCLVHFGAEGCVACALFQGQDLEGLPLALLSLLLGPLFQQVDRIPFCFALYRK